MTIEDWKHMDAADSKASEAADETAGAADTATRRVSNDDFLVPGPTPESNEGLARWGLSWLLFSVVLILVMLGISFFCWLIAMAIGVR